jgi:hypothetical protein
LAISLQELVILTAATTLIMLAISRVLRVRAGRSPHPDGRARLPFLLTFLFLPPVVVEVVVVLRPTTSATQLHIIESVLLYLGALFAFMILMGVAALIAGEIAPGRWRPMILLALAGSEPDPNDVVIDPAFTPKLAGDVVLVDTANAAFPRGPEFAAQIDRTGFRVDWDALDAATGTLEGQIADDHRLGVAVGSKATTTAQDARSRLDTLRRLAVDGGQALAS